MGAKWQKFRVEIPEELGPEDREQLAADIIEFMIDRSKKGFDKNNKAFPSYSDSYIKSLDFRNAGKTSGAVNLTLSGDMLADMHLLSHSRGTLLIGFENDTDVNDRADGNIRGTYGQSSPDPKKKRDFLGIAPQDLDSILSTYISDDEESDDESEEAEEQESEDLDEREVDDDF